MFLTVIMGNECPLLVYCDFLCSTLINNHNFLQVSQNWVINAHLCVKNGGNFGRFEGL